MLAKILASFFVSLIPKVESSLKLRDFIPISLLGSLYEFNGEGIGGYEVMIYGEVDFPKVINLCRGEAFGGWSGCYELGVARRSRHACFVRTFI